MPTRGVQVNRSEGKRLGMRLLWLPILGLCTVGVSFGLPLFLYLRERALESAGAAKPVTAAAQACWNSAPTRSAGRKKARPPARSACTFRITLETGSFRL